MVHFIFCMKFPFDSCMNVSLGMLCVWMCHHPYTLHDIFKMYELWRIIASYKQVDKNLSFYRSHLLMFFKLICYFVKLSDDAQAFGLN